MKAENHEIQSTLTTDQLKQKFSNGKDLNNYRAFYFGNWIADLSQVIDPPGYAAASKAASNGIEKIINTIKNSIEELASTLFSVVPGGSKIKKYFKPLLPDIEPYLKPAIDSLTNQIEFFLKCQSDGNNGPLAKFLEDVVFFIGYFKFSHPSKHEKTLPLKIYRQLFKGKSPSDKNRLFNQYFPYMHLDRGRQTKTTYYPGYQPRKRPFRLEKGKRKGTRAKTLNETLDPDHYSYLRDYLEIIAGKFAYVDRRMQSHFERGVKEDDFEFCKTLAIYGEAMHAIEDFYAHSNYVELAASTLGKDFIKSRFPPKTGLEMIDRGYTIFNKRLRRYVSEPYENWLRHPKEDWVVTGYFDISDTLISLLHLSEEAFGFDVDDPYHKAHKTHDHISETVTNPNKTLNKMKKKMRESLDLVLDAEAAIKDESNETAKYFHNIYKDSTRSLFRPELSQKAAHTIISHSEILKHAPAEIQRVFINIIVQGTKIYKVGSFTYTLYGTIKEITSFLASPIKWILSWLPKWLREKVVNSLKFYAKDWLYNVLGGQNIGSHSLLAKDHGNEPCYELSQNLSQASHYHLSKLILRWDTLNTQNYIDWLHSIEALTRNPFLNQSLSSQIVKRDIPVTIFHEVKKGEQLDSKNPKYSITKMYKHSSFYKNLHNWKLIADVNFNTYDLSIKETQIVINETLKQQKLGVKVKHPNYAFKPGVLLSIPYQRGFGYFLESASESDKWYAKIFDYGWEIAKNGKYRHKKSNEEISFSMPEPNYVTRDDSYQMELRGLKLTRKYKKLYSVENLVK